MTREKIIADVEHLLLHDLRAFRDGAINIAATEVDRKGHADRLSRAGWEHFAQKADYSYFVSRILLAQHIYLYGFFCAHQCVECYLKASLKKAGSKIPQHHNLNALLTECRKVFPDSESFLQTDYAQALGLKFDPFYEFPRYPTQTTRPAGGKYMWASGDSERVLDYFVYRMRDLLGFAPKHWDVLGPDGHYDLLLTTRKQPRVNALFRAGNLNFMA